MNVFGIFAKFWEPGTVKTRLAKSIGFQLAAEVYFQFLKSSLGLGNQFELLQEAAPCKKTIGFSPVEKRKEFAELSPNWNLIPQSEGNLGTRMKCFFDSCFAQSDTTEKNHVVLIGSDTPALPCEIISDAFRLLKHNDVVLGPSFDGGYYLIGCSHSTPNIFENIDWSTSRVFGQTIAQLDQRNYKYAVLQKHNDVDELDDLRMLQRELNQQRDQLASHQTELQDFLSKLKLVNEV